MASRSEASLPTCGPVDSIHRKRSPFFGPERFHVTNRKNNRYICSCWPIPQLRWPSFIAIEPSTTSGHPKSAARAPLRPQCTRAAFRGLIIHQKRNQLDNVRGCWSTRQSFAKAQRQKKEGGSLVSRKLKNQIGLRRLRLRRLRFVSEQFLPGSGSSETSSDWCASSVSRQHRFCRLPLSRTEDKKTDDACSQMKKA